jgi:hypothetical protein
VFALLIVGQTIVEGIGDKGVDMARREDLSCEKEQEEEDEDPSRKRREESCENDAF